jgi:hypothetical protein
MIPLRLYFQVHERLCNHSNRSFEVGCAQNIHDQHSAGRIGTGGKVGFFVYLRKLKSRTTSVSSVLNKSLGSQYGGQSENGPRDIFARGLAQFDVAERK